MRPCPKGCGRIFMGDGKTDRSNYRAATAASANGLAGPDYFNEGACAFGDDSGLVVPDVVVVGLAGLVAANAEGGVGGGRAI